MNQVVEKAMQNEMIQGLGYGLKMTSQIKEVRPLLKACNLVEHDDGGRGAETRYLMATTPAGGVAAAVGWSIFSGGDAVLHSLAVAPSSRGSGVGASQLASAMRYLREERAVRAIYIQAQGAVGFFRGFGFVELDGQSVPGELANHSALGSAQGQLMVRRYGEARRGLDQSAFLLVHNTTPDATLPVGSVFWFRQSGPVLEAFYRGGPVIKGHLLGARDGEALRFLWQQCVDEGRLMRGRGEIFVHLLEDGRRELREKLGEHPGELLLREL